MTNERDQGEDAPKRERPQRDPIQAGAPILPVAARNLEDVVRMGELYAHGEEAVPKEYRGKPRIISAIISRGAEIGLAPMQSLSSIAIINGRASIWGAGVKALILKAGHRLEVTFEGEKGGPDRKAIATLTRRDTGQVFTAEFGYQDAKRASLLGKDTYQKYPDRMFQARAIGFVAQDGAADVLMGLEVSEAMQDITPVAEAAPVGDNPFAHRIRPQAEEIPEAEVITEENNQESAND